MDKIAVIGAGTMGAGIAQVALEGGCQVTLIDTKIELVERGLETIRGFLAKKLAKEKIDQRQYEDYLLNLHGSTILEYGVKGAVMVIEAVFEDLQVKEEIFRKLDDVCPPEVILASNTSTLPIAKIASVVKHPRRVIGTHYFSPVPLMRLVEVIKTDTTGDDVLERTMELCRRFGKTPIAVKDVPGFIVNRLLCLIYNETANMINNGVATAGDIDEALKLGCNWPMGAAEIMDMAGVDVATNALQAMFEMTGEERYRPSPLLGEMVSQNRKGKKTGKGFYEYRQS